MTRRNRRNAVSMKAMAIFHQLELCLWVILIVTTTLCLAYVILLENIAANRLANRIKSSVVKATLLDDHDNNNHVTGRLQSRAMPHTPNNNNNHNNNNKYNNNYNNNNNGNNSNNNNDSSNINNNPRFPRQTGDAITNGSKFVVFDSVRYTGSLSFLDSQAPGWVVLVVNIRSPQLGSCRRCHVMTKTWATSFLGSRRAKMLAPWVAVKMAAFLFVLTFDPTWIYTTDKPGPMAYQSLDRVADRTGMRTGLVYRGEKNDIFDPCRHFMDPFVWNSPSPRSFPDAYTIRPVTGQAIYQLVNDCFPSRLSYHGDDWKHLLDERAAIPYVLPGLFAVLDFSNVLVPRKAAWTLVASLGKRFTSSKLLFGLVMQRALWETDAHLGFLPSTPFEKQCTPCMLRASIESQGRLLKQNLTDAICTASMSVAACLVQFQEMTHVPNGPEPTVTGVLRVWLGALRDIGVSVSERIPLNEGKLADQRLGRAVYYTPAKSLSMTSLNASIRHTSFTRICKDKGRLYRSSLPNRLPFAGVLVAVLIRRPHHAMQIPMMEYLYGRYFSHVVYCSHDIDVFSNIYKGQLAQNPVTFVAIDDAQNTLSCVNAAIKMNYDVSGYFLVTDDILVNLWNLHSMPFHRPWLAGGYEVGHTTDYFNFHPDRAMAANNMQQGLGAGKYTPLGLAWEELNKLKNDRQLGARVSKFLERSYNNTGCHYCSFYAVNDIVYLPKNISHEFVFFAELFQRFHVDFRLTFAVAIGGLVPRQEVYHLNWKCVTPLNSKIDTSIIQSHDNCHTWRPTSLAEMAWTQFFCHTFLERLDRDLREL